MCIRDSSSTRLKLTYQHSLSDIVWHKQHCTWLVTMHIIVGAWDWTIIWTNVFCPRQILYIIMELGSICSTCLIPRLSSSSICTVVSWKRAHGRRVQYWRYYCHCDNAIFSNVGDIARGYITSVPNKAHSYIYVNDRIQHAELTHNNCNSWAIPSCSFDIKTFLMQHWKLEVIYLHGYKQG